MNILIIAPHPDDLEFGCAATIAKFLHEGATVKVMLTVGPHAAEVTQGRTKEVVTAELNASMALLDLDWHKMPLVDSPPWDQPHFQCTPNHVTWLDNSYPGEHFDLVITSDPGDYHQDHVETFKLAESFSRKNVDELWTMDILPYSNMNKTFVPNVFVDVSKHFEMKLHMLACYKSVLKTSTDYAQVTAQATYRAAQVRIDPFKGGDATYVEAFNQVFRKIGR